MKKIVIAKMPIKNRNALAAVCYEDGQAVEFFVRPETGDVSEGSIYNGIVEKVDARLDAAFVRIGKDTSGYLPLKKAKHIVFAGPKKEGGLKPNDRILVMVEKAAVKTKHCVLTCDLAVSGKYLVLHSEEGGRILCSKKLPREEVRRLSGVLSDIISGAETPDEDNSTAAGAAKNFSQDTDPEPERKQKSGSSAYSITVRTLASEAETGKIAEEYKELKSVMDRVIRCGVSRPAGTCLYTGSTPEADMLKRVPEEDLEEVVTDSEEVFQMLTEELCPLLFTDPAKIRLYRDPMLDLYRLYNFSSLLTRITEKKVNLRSGASLIIEPAEACVVIDVNSANSSKKYKNASSFLPLNLEAAEEIAVQIRLRQLSGIILIDFINMDDPKEEKELAEFFKKCIARDPVKTSYVDITKLGIMEVTREKRNRSIGEQVGRLR